MSQAAADEQVPTPDGPAPARPSRGRVIAAVVCVVLAALLTAPAAIAYWGQRTINDAQRYVATVGPLSSSPEVQEALAGTVTDAIQQQVDIEGLLEDVFSAVVPDRPRLQRLAGPLATAIDGAVESQVQAFFASDTFDDVWVRVNTRAQQALQRFLQGEGSGAVALQDGQLVLEVSEVIDEVKERLVDRGLTFVENAPIPQTDRQIVLLEAPQLEQLRTVYAFTNPVARWLLPLVLVLYLAGFVLARRRPRMTVAIGAAIVANALLLGFLLAVGGQLFENHLAGTRFGPASTVFYETLLAYLDRGQQVFLWLGLALLVGGWFAGANRYGTAVRTTVAQGLERVGAALPDELPVARWVAANVGWLRMAAAGLGLVVLFWGNDVSLTRWWWSLALVVVLLAGLQVLVGADPGRRAANTSPGMRSEERADPSVDPTKSGLPSTGS